MRSNKIEAYKNTLKLTDRQKQILVGLLLGDGHLETQNSGRTYRLKIAQSIQHKEYVDWLYQEFKEWTLTSPKEKINNRYGKKHTQYWFSTISHGSFRFYAQQFYRGKKKVLPRLIHRWLSPLTIAIWFMDNGSIKSHRNRALIINTQSFTKRENERLIKIFKGTFDITMTLRPQRQQYQLYITSESVHRFINNIQSFVLPSMQYKLGKLGTQLPKR